MARDCTFQWDLDGVSEICKSPEMQNVLEQEASRIASSANSVAATYADRLHLGKQGFKQEPYRGKCKVLSKTAIGWVTSTFIGALAQKKFKCLSSVNH